MTIVLAFDIERSGATSQYQTIAIGASVVDSEWNELDSFFMCNYRQEETKFEPRCWDEFWSQHPETLSKLEYKGLLSLHNQEKAMIEGFQQFRAMWEQRAKEAKVKYVFVSDNNVYDGSFVNQLIEKHTSFLPIPFTASVPQKYSAFWETHSMQKGFLMNESDTYVDKNWGLAKSLQELYPTIPPMKKKHNHLPHYDAYTIAYEYHVMIKLSRGEIR